MRAGSATEAGYPRSGWPKEVSRAKGKRRTVHQSGLTFVELLIAVLMVAILFVGLAAHLRGGIAVWQRVTRSTDIRQRERAGIERLSHDLASAFVLDERSESYGSAEAALSPVSFAASAISFYTAPTRDGSHQTPVQFLTYWCGTLGEHSGLWRRRWSLDESRAKRGPQAELIMPECESLTFSYAYLRSDDPSQQSEPLDWQASWQETPKALPRLIRMEMKLAETTQGHGGAVQTIHRTIKQMLLIPTGVLRAPSQA